MPTLDEQAEITRQTPAPATEKPVPIALLKAVEAQWLSRAKAQGLPGPVTVTYRRAETEFFVGAMAMLSAMGYQQPARWVMSVWASRNIVEPKP